MDAWLLGEHETSLSHRLARSADRATTQTVKKAARKAPVTPQEVVTQGTRVGSRVVACLAPQWSLLSDCLGQNHPIGIAKSGRF